MNSIEHVPDPSVLKLQDWASWEWLDMQCELTSDAELSARLHSVVSQGVGYGQRGLCLDMAVGEIVRVILTGIAATNSHKIGDLEKALGVPFPPEVKYK